MAGKTPEARAMEALGKFEVPAEWGKPMKGGREGRIMNRIDAAIASADRVETMYEKLKQENTALKMEIQALKEALRRTLDLIGPDKMLSMRQRRMDTWNRARRSRLRRTKSAPNLLACMGIVREVEE